MVWNLPLYLTWFIPSNKQAISKEQVEGDINFMLDMQSDKLPFWGMEPWALILDKQRG